MADDNNFSEEIALLESMFGGSVSSDVITSVLESCGGNVHIAADAIMNISDDIPIASQDVEEGIDLRPVHVPPALNVNARPFACPQRQSSQEPCPTENPQSSILQEQPAQWQDHSNMATLQSLVSLNVHSNNANQQHFTTPNKQTNVINHQLLTNPRQSPTTEYRQSPTSTRQLPSTSARIPLANYNQQPPSTGPLPTAQAQSVPYSYLKAYQNSGALPKKPPDSKPQKPRYTMNVWHDQVGKILHYHNQGTRTLIIMRGVSGSGKTHLARHIVDYTIGPSPQNYAQHIFSSDSYFMRRGVYQYNRNSLHEAHSMNQRKVCESTNNGVSPVIIDNTNTELWEMEPYIRDGVRNGYVIEFVEPNTPWSKNATLLEKRNTHCVPREQIKRMLDRYEKGLTPESARRALRLNYPHNRQPPVCRNIPPFSPSGSPERTNINTVENNQNRLSHTVRVEITRPDGLDAGDREDVKTNAGCETETSHDNVDKKAIDEHETKLKKIIEAQKNIDQFEKVEQEWENGESWDTVTRENKTSSPIAVDSVGPITSVPKPPRSGENKDSNTPLEPSQTLIDDANDWSKLSMFLQPWPGSNNASSCMTVETPVYVETRSIGTGFEVEDMNEAMYAVLYSTPRDINEGLPEKTRPKIAKTITVDKSTSTHEDDFLAKKEVCKNKELHFRELRRMFKSVSVHSLRDIFESCNCDVNWAVNLVLDGYPEIQKNFNTDVIDSDDEEDGLIEECNCLAGYNIVPDVAPPFEILPTQEPENLHLISTPVTQKKIKRENKQSDNSKVLKRQIESNVVISDNHYSQLYLNWRRRREQKINCRDRATANVSNSANAENMAQANLTAPSPNENATRLPESSPNTYKYSTDPRDVAGPSTAQYNLEFLDSIDSDTESDSNNSDGLENTVTITLGPEFLGKLDELFGRKDFVYPEYIQPVLNLPISILHQINAHWALSVAAQMDDRTQQTEEMIKQDEEFARQLATREQEMTEEGKEPEVPTLKEIMDMELAYSIYERGVAEWRNNEPQDLAAKMSRDKLYNLFPDTSKDVLSEILMAHDYSFKATVESLIVSTGQSNWLEDEKGIEKFVMNKEMERKQKFLEEQQKNLDEAEWPYLSNPEKPVTMETVNFYRAEAEKSLQCRNTNFEKARQYFAKNSPAAASFYSEIAAMHTKKYEQSSCLAAAYLMNYHLMKNPDQDVLDLHYLRVPEALVNLDIFLDRTIERLRDKNLRSKEIFIITGKGIHSQAGPRIKPATKKRLFERGIRSKFVNGGLLMSEIRPADKMMCELKENK